MVAALSQSINPAKVRLNGRKYPTTRLGLVTMFTVWYLVVWHSFGFFEEGIYHLTTRGVRRAIADINRCLERCSRVLLARGDARSSRRAVRFAY